MAPKNLRLIELGSTIQTVPKEPSGGQPPSLWNQIVGLVWKTSKPGPPGEQRPTVEAGPVVSGQDVFRDLAGKAKVLPNKPGG